MKLTRSLGMITLSIWLILTGVMQLANLPIPGVVMAILAIVAGILILIGR